MQRWWLENHPGSAGADDTVFQREYVQLLAQLAQLSPRSPLGTRHRNVPRRETWRVRLQKSQQYIYYSIKEAEDLVEIVMISG